MRAVVAILFSLQIVHLQAEDMHILLAINALVQQLHFRMISFGNSTKSFLASSTYQKAHTFPVLVGIST
jgi:hypothetical protein